MHFLKYFIKNSFRGWAWGGAGRPVPIRGGVGCSIFNPNMVWGRERVHGSVGRDGNG